MLGLSKSRGEFEVESDLDAPPAAVWDRVSTPEGINAELAPILRMTVPDGVTLGAGRVPLGRRWFRSWILLGGIVPIDYDDLTVIRLEPGRGFLERSPMLSQRVWEHERTLEPIEGRRCRVIDRVRFEPRIPIPARWLVPLFRAIFRHRHRRLRQRFGAAAVG